MNSSIINGSAETVYNLSFSSWVVYESCSIALILLSFYIFLVLLRFTCIKSHHFVFLKRGSKDKTSPIQDLHLEAIKQGSVTGVSVRQVKISVRERTTKRNKNVSRNNSASALRVLCLIGSLFALFRIGADQLELATFNGPRTNCKIYQVTVVCTYALSATCIYSALWLRLRVFFYHPIMKHLTSHTVIFFIWLALFCILSSSLLNTTIFIVTVEAVDSVNGCILGETKTVAPATRYIILTISTVSSQGILLCLFLYPLLKHRSKIRSLSSQKHPHLHFAVGSGKGGPSFVRVQMDPIILNESLKDGNMLSLQLSKRLNREKRLVAIIIRVLITAVVCVVSDVIAAVSTILLNDYPRVVTNMVFNLNLLINLVSVLLSFGDWQERLVPCCPTRKKATDYNKTRAGISSIILKNSLQDGSFEERNHNFNKMVLQTLNKQTLNIKQPLEITKNDDTQTSIGNENF